MAIKANFLGNEKLEEKMIRHISDFVSTMKSARSEVEKKWDTFYKIWKSETDDKQSPYQGRAKTFAPYGHRAVEVFAARAPEVIFGRDEPFKIVDPIDKSPYGTLMAQLNTAKLIKQFNETQQRSKWQQFFRSLAIYGTSVASVTWRYETRDVYQKIKREEPVYNETDGSVTGIRIVEDEVVKSVDTFDAPDMRNIDLKKFYIDPTAEDIDSASGVIEETRASYNQLLRMAKNEIFNIRRVKELKQESPEQKSQDIGMEEPTDVTDERFETTGFSSMDYSEKPYKIYEYWGLFEIESGNEVEVVATMVGKTLIRFERNPFYHQKKPYILAQYITDDQSIYGVGMLEAVRRDILTANTIKNQMLDRTTQVLNNMWLKSRAAGIKKTELKYRPNGVIETNTMDGLQPLRPDEGSMIQALRMLEYIDKSTQETTGATKLLAGTETELVKQSTAFAVKANLSESNVKFKTILDQIMEQAVKRWITFAQDLNAQFCEYDDYVKILGPGPAQVYQSRRITPDQILSNYDIEIVAGDELIQDSFQVQNIVSFLNWWVQIYPVMAQLNQGKPLLIPDFTELGKQIWNKLGFKEPLPIMEVQPPMLGQPQLPQGGQQQPQLPSGGPDVGNQIAPQ